MVRIENHRKKNRIQTIKKGIAKSLHKRWKILSKQKRMKKQTEKRKMYTCTPKKSKK